MKLSCLQKNLLDALTIVGRAVPTRSSLPVLSNVLLATEDGRLKLAATNLEMAITVYIGAMVEEEGAITLPARLLTEWVSLQEKDARIEMTLNPRNRKMRLVSGRFDANISGIDAEEFPAIPVVEEGTAASFDAAQFKAAVEQVVFAAASDDTRPVLAGVLVRLAEGKLVLAAADGFRLAVRMVDAPGDESAELSMIVPARTLADLARVLPDEEGKVVELAATPNRAQVLFQYGDLQLVSRLIDGQFPDYQRIIPREAKTKAVLPTRELLQATRAASVFARDSTSMIVRLQLTPPEVEKDLALGAVTVRSSESELGDNTGELEARIEGEEQQVAFNGKYLRDALEALGTSEVVLELTGPSSPGLLHPPNDTERTHLHVIMPMHLAR